MMMKMLKKKSNFGATAVGFQIAFFEYRRSYI